MPKLGNGLASIPDWDPPKDKFLWPWQWGWSLADNSHEKDKPNILLLREAVRSAFLDTDPAGMEFGGTWFPESEYDTEVDRATSWLTKGVPPGEIAARTMRVLVRDWGIEVQARKQEQLTQALESIGPRPDLPTNH